jgi:hypothetical protein
VRSNLKLWYLVKVKLNILVRTSKEVKRRSYSQCDKSIPTRHIATFEPGISNLNVLVICIFFSLLIWNSEIHTSSYDFFCWNKLVSVFPYRDMASITFTYIYYFQAQQTARSRINSNKIPSCSGMKEEGWSFTRSKRK